MTKSSRYPATTLRTSTSSTTLQVSPRAHKFLPHAQCNKDRYKDVYIRMCVCVCVCNVRTWIRTTMYVKT